MFTRYFSVRRDTFVVSSHPKKNFGQDDHLLTGKSQGHSFLSFVEFNLDIEPQVTINEGSIILYLSDNETSQSQVLQVRRCLEKWKEKKVTYKDLPLIGNTIEGSVTVSGEQKKIKIDITNLVSMWYSGEAQNFGVCLMSGPEGTLEFASKNEGNSLYHPLLLVKYSTAPVYVSLQPFVEEKYQNLVTTDDSQSIPWFNTQDAFQVSFAVFNTGAHAAFVELEVSPDGNDCIIDTTETIPAGEGRVVVPNFFLKYSRITYRSAQPGMPTTLNITYQRK